MSYQALYRKFRPGAFDEVKGQEHIVTTLQNQIKADRIGHAYLFCGTRGTGKTTIAKILAKAVNCQNPVDGSPCGECACCKSISSGASLNVIEIDAASNNGVDNIRQIREEVEYPPTEGKYKVYIIDEVHMLSTGAFNAMLKTLEEPPSYVIFILATTEVHKIPITIMSRCQRYDFRRISVETIEGRLRELMETEQIATEEKAIRYIAKAADGSMRDALSLLDRCIAFYLGEELTYDKVIEVLGATDTDVYSSLFDALCNDQAKRAVAMVDEVFVLGREPGQFVADFTWYLRNLLLIQGDDNMEDIIDMSHDNLEILKEQAKNASPEKLMRFIEIFSELSDKLRYSTQKRILIEIAIIRMLRPAMDTDNYALMQRIEDVEYKIANGMVVADYEPSSGESRPQSSTPSFVKKELPKSISTDVETVINRWNEVLADFSNGFLGAMIQKTTRSATKEGTLLLVFDDEFDYNRVMSKPEYLEDIKSALSKISGKDMPVETVLNSTGRSNGEAYGDLERAIREKTIVIEGNIEIEEED